MIDHIGLSVGKYEAAKEFYTQALAPLGYVLVMDIVPPMHPVRAAGFGKDGKPDFWISEEGKTFPRTHIAILADNRASVDAFYEAALTAGAQDNGKPGIREMYHPNYYGAFVIDPEGHNLEAVCHRPE